MTERLNKLYELLKFSLQVQHLSRALPDSETDDELHGVLRKSHEVAELNNALAEDLASRYFAEKYDIIYGRSVVQVTTPEGSAEGAMLVTAVSLSAPAVRRGLVGYRFGFTLLGRWYNPGCSRVGAIALVEFDETVNDTLRKLHDVPDDSKA
jgi:hypothetical protein